MAINFDDLNNPLTPQERSVLQGFLTSCATDDRCMTLEGLDGFICAIAVGPELVMPSEWLPWVWGGDGVEPEFASSDEADMILNLIMRHWNTVLGTVRNNPLTDTGAFQPLIEDITEITGNSSSVQGFGSQWARGFMRGMTLNQSDWTHASSVEPIEKALSMLLLISHGDDSEFVKRTITQDERRSVVEMLPGLVHGMWQYWRGQERQRHDLQSAGLSKKSVGRNDPCPCGSGKKFKKCCLH